MQLHTGRGRSEGVALPFVCVCVRTVRRRKRQREGAVQIDLNGEQRSIATTADAQGHKQFLAFTIEGQQLRYRFRFHSSKVPKVLHPFLTPGEVVLLRDRNPVPSLGAQMGRLVAQALDADDGKRLTKGRKVSNGYVDDVWKLEEEVKLLVFRGSTLCFELDFTGGNLDAQLPVGEYACIAIISRFYAYCPLPPSAAASASAHLRPPPSPLPSPSPLSSLQVLHPRLPGGSLLP